MIGLPEIRSVKEFSKLLRIPESTIYGFSQRNYKTGYKEFYLPKKPKGIRVIHSPVRILKFVQAWILKNILSKLNSHKSSTGFEKGDNILNNAKRHIDQSYVINVDIKDFFPSITAEKVYSIFSAIGYEKEVAWTLTNLVTYKGTLPQGSPCSPKLANLICHRLDARIYGFCKSKNMVYSRYADDITISTSNRKNISATLRYLKNVITAEGFLIREEKTNVFGRGSAKVITGLTVSKEVRIGRKKYRELRSRILNAELSDNQIELSYLEGYVNFLKGIDHKTYTMLLKYKDKISKIKESISA